MGTAIGFVAPQAEQAFANRTPAPMADGADSGDSGSSQSASITANDFLTLLVTEMKNQDPTANQDPNAYINQLVQVNSLQQLISINEVLTNSLGAPASSSDSTKSTEVASGDRNAGVVRFDMPAAAEFIKPESIAGNLGIPDGSPSATGLAHALDGRRSSGVLTGR